MINIFGDDLDYDVDPERNYCCCVMGAIVPILLITQKSCQQSLMKFLEQFDVSLAANHYLLLLIQIMIQSQNFFNGIFARESPTMTGV